jgi:hypothetical protein
MAISKGIKLDAKIIDIIEEEDYNNLRDYMAKVALAQSYIKNLKLNIRKLFDVKAELPSAVADKEKELSSAIDLLIRNSLDLQQKVKLIIDSNSAYVEENQKNSMMLEQEKRIIVNLHGSLIRNFQDEVSDFQMIQSEIKNYKQNLTVRNAEIVIGRKLDNQEKESVVNDPKVLNFKNF